MPAAFFVANFPTPVDVQPEATGQIRICPGFNGMKFIKQMDSELCWAAVLSAINRSASRSPTDQRDIVIEVFGSFSNLPVPLDVAFRGLGLSIDDRLSGSFDKDRIQQAYLARLPVAVAVRWEATTKARGHALCLFGWRTIKGSVSHVLIYDPWETNSSNDFVVEIPLSALPSYLEAAAAGMRGQWAEMLVAA